MTLEVAAIVKDASDIDYIPIVVAPVKDEMARIVYDAEGSLGAVAAETDMVRPSVRAPFIMISDLSMEP